MTQLIDIAIIVGVVALCALWYAVGRNDGYKRGTAKILELFKEEISASLVDPEVIKDINRQERLEDLDMEQQLAERA